jgi:hypothetical protein
MVLALGHIKANPNMLKEEFSNAFRYYAILTRCQQHQFRESINNCKDMVITMLGRRKTG